ncbi:dixin [Mayamaea pseudoterrestris]|nr:dixin [Mayamaea pseudoterrestris]
MKPTDSSRLQRAFAVLAILAIAVQCTFRNTYLLHLFDSTIIDSFQDQENHWRSNVYLQGNYAPVSEEHVHVPVEGSLPSDLNGLFLRNGPNNGFATTKKRYHWFDGDGMIHSLRIVDGKAYYNNQFIPTPRYKTEQSYGEELFMRLGEITGMTGLFKLLFVSPNMLRNNGLTDLTAGQANTHTLMYNDKFYACYESSLPFELILDDKGAVQAAVGYDTFGGTLNYPVSAHAKIDPVTNSLLFHSYSGDAEMVKRDGPIKVGEYHGPSDTFGVYQGISLNHFPFAHDMAFTKNYLIVYDGSVHFQKEKLMEFGASIFGWNSSHTMKIGLMSRSDGHLDWFETNKAMSIVHTLTAWEEEDGTVVMWAPASDKVDLGLEDHNNEFFMTEFRMRPGTAEATMVVASAEHNVEFPRVRDECLGKPCRFGYAGWMTKTTGAGQFQGWAQFDLQAKKVNQVVHFGEGENGGEPVVIPKPGSTESNQVYIGTFIHNDSENADYFVLYDGETTELVTRIKMPYRIPFGFHGQWVNGESLDAHVAYHEANNSTKNATAVM